MGKDRIETATEIWICAPGVDAASLRTPLTAFRLTARLASACAAVGATTLAEVLALRQEELLAIKGVGQRQWQQLKSAVCRHLRHHRRPRPSGRGGRVDLTLLQPRAQLALTRLGLTTCESWLAAAPDALQAIPDLDANVVAALQATVVSAPSVTVWPLRILRTSLLRLALPARLRRALAAGGYKTLGDLRCADAQQLAALPSVGATGVRTLRGALARGLALQPSLRARRRLLEASGLERMLRRISGAERELVELCVGLTGQRRTQAQLARALDVPLDAIAAHVARARAALEARGGGVLRRLRAAAAEELRAQGGVLHPNHIASASPLRTLTNTDADPLLALRLLAFLRPDALALVGGVLMDLPAATYPRVARELTRAVHTLYLPMPLREVHEHLTAAGLTQLPRGVFEALLQRVPRVQIVVDPRIGEVLDRRPVAVTTRVEAILRSASSSLTASDILFAYRDRFGSARRTRLVDALHTERVFLRVGSDEWNLRERHLDELELAQPEADRVRDRIIASDGALSLVDLVDPGASSRLVYLVRDLLHHDPTLRSLGRGRFCARGLRVSTHVKTLRLELRRAMGEVPLQRFLSNQPESVRQIRARLLAENRLFVGTAPDRVDMITNYPLNDERLRRLLQAVETLIEEAGGHDRVDRLAAKMRTDEVGGSFLTPYFLADLLRRHGRFETIAGDVITIAASGMRHRLLSRVRAVVRSADRALSVNEILAASPDLAEFATGLPDLLRSDPLVQQHDERYCVP